MQTERHGKLNAYRRDPREGLKYPVSRVGDAPEAVDRLFPHFSDSKIGERETTTNGNWCGGNWVGLLWLATEHIEGSSDAEQFETAAYAYSETMRPYMPRDFMFC